MTAIEVLAATVLSTLMFAAVVGVLAGMARQSKVLESKQTTPAWNEQFVGELTWDLRNAKTLTPTQTGLVLEGFAGRDFATGVATDRPALVEYRVVQVEGQSMLVRRETHPDELSNENTRTDLVALGIAGMSLNNTDNRQHGTGVSSAPRNLPNQPLPVPEQLRIMLVGADSQLPLFDRQFITR